MKLKAGITDHLTRFACLNNAVIHVVRVLETSIPYCSVPVLSPKFESIFLLELLHGNAQTQCELLLR